MSVIKILHFADAHIDIAGHGRHDPLSGLPLRVVDFLKALDTIVDTAIEEKVDLVIFAGDAYKDRTPVPTFQREWGKRILRLSQAGLRTLMLVGNHDLSPALGRAHALQEFDTLQIPHVTVISRPRLLGPADLEDLPLQVMALPWVSRSGMLAAMQNGAGVPEDIYGELEKLISELIGQWFEKLDPALPTVFTAHASVQGAKYGGERSVMLGSDLVLPASLVCDPRLDYTALGHIHKAQNLNENRHPPVVYPGSIERVDFGEAADDKFFVLAHVSRAETRIEWRKLEGRRFIDRKVSLAAEKDAHALLENALPTPAEMEAAIVRLVIEYPRDLEPLIDETSLRRQAEGAFEFHLVRRPQIEARRRIPGDQAISSLPPLELLDLYWKQANIDPLEAEELNTLAQKIIFSGDSKE